MKIIKSLRNKLNKDQRRKNNNNSINDVVEVVDINEITAHTPTTTKALDETNYYGDIKVVDVNVDVDDDIEKVIVVDTTNTPKQNQQKKTNCSKWKAIKIAVGINLVIGGIVLTCLLVFGGGTFGLIAFGFGILVATIPIIKMALRK